MASNVPASCTTYREGQLIGMPCSPVCNDLIIEDINGDGNKDILAAGNSYDPDVSTGNYDAKAALLLTGDGKGNFEPAPNVYAGLTINGEIRRIIHLGKHYIFLKNNSAAEAAKSN